MSFLAGALLCSLIEFGMGMIVNADYQLWDYRENFGNFMGQVCLQNTMAFGVVAAIITWWVYPLLERLISRVPRDIMNIAFVVIAVFGAIIWSLYLVEPADSGDGSSVEGEQDPALVQREVEQRAAGSKLAQIDAILDDLERLADSVTEIDADRSRPM